jgi:hypothetical protein
LSSIIPIDISVMSIARSVVRLTRLPISVAFVEWVTMPSAPPSIVQPSTVLSSRSNENEMSIPCV